MYIEFLFYFVCVIFLVYKNVVLLSFCMLSDSESEPPVKRLSV
jgi:hypothetical protein